MPPVEPRPAGCTCCPVHRSGELIENKILRVESPLLDKLQRAIDDARGRMDAARERWTDLEQQRRALDFKLSKAEQTNGRVSRSDRRELEKLVTAAKRAQGDYEEVGAEVVVAEQERRAEHARAIEELIRSW